MEFNLCILLYSKYSSNSKKLIDYISNSNVDLVNFLKLHTICVDNEEIRKKIIKCTHIGINSVPSLLLTYQDGRLEKYDGLNIFSWFQEIIEKIIKSQHINKPPVIQNQHINQPVIKQNQHINQPVIKQKTQNDTQFLIEKDEHSKLLEENRKKYEDRNNVELKIPDKIKKSKKTNNVTNLEELVSEGEEQIDRYKNRKPKSQIRKNKGNYEEGDFFKESPSQEVNKSKASIQKVSDVMNKAKELAKGRESISINPGQFSKT